MHGTSVSMCIFTAAFLRRCFAQSMQLWTRLIVEDFARLGEDGAHREATPSRPLLQQTVGKLTRYAGRTELTLFVGGRPETKRLFRQIETAIE